VGDRDNNGNPVMKTPPLLDWKYVQLNLPWGVILLMGGGFALSNAVVYSGLSSWLGEQLNAVETFPLSLILVVVMILTAILTEVASNSACVNVVIPILIALVIFDLI
jgi:sodium-dependent dicarboxylate transporter 2/3/5